MKAWGFRRAAYRQMLEVLLTEGPEENCERLKIAQKMYDDIYGAESPSTKHLNQIETPPLTQAAIEAREALLSAQMFLENSLLEVEVAP